MVLWLKTDGAMTKPRASCGRSTHGCAARHALVSWLVVVIHYETISMGYLGTICFCYMGFYVGTSSVVVSWLMTYGAAAKLRASCECAHRTVLLVGCWYQGLWSWSIMELPWCVNSCRSFPWNNFYVVCQMIEQHLSSPSDQKGIPLSCVVLFLLILVVTTHTSSLDILWVKVKPWIFLVLGDNWLVLKMEIDFSCC